MHATWRGGRTRSRTSDRHSPERRVSSSRAGANYLSGDDYVIEFLWYRFGFNAVDFEQRVVAAAVQARAWSRRATSTRRRRPTSSSSSSEERIAEPRSALGDYLVRHWERLALVDNQSLVYWLRKLVFRGAWLDHRVKERLLEVAWDDEPREFSYRDPRGGRALLELAPVPSWHELQYKR